MDVLVSAWRDVLGSYDSILGGFFHKRTHAHKIGVITHMNINPIIIIIIRKDPSSFVVLFGDVVYEEDAVGDIIIIYCLYSHIFHFFVKPVNLKHYY